MRRGFLDAIREAPDDDAPRLVFADWLEETGEPDRAEFIRAQVRGENRRADELHKLHGARWRAELPRLEGTVWNEFERGFIGSVSAATVRNFLAQAPALFDAAPVTRLQAERVDSAAFGQLCDSRYLLRLSELFVGNNTGLSSEDVRTLAGSSNAANLRSLLIHQNPVGNPALAALSHSPHLSKLRELYASGIGATDCGVLALLSGRRLRLELLDLRDNRIAEDGAAALAAWSDGPRTLWLVNNPIRDAGAMAFAQSCPPKLRHLDLSHCGITDAGARALAESSPFSQLEELALRGNVLRQESWAQLRSRFGEKLIE